MNKKIINKTCPLCNGTIFQEDEDIVNVPSHISKEIGVTGLSHYYCLSKYIYDLEYSKIAINFSCEEIKSNIDKSIENIFQDIQNKNIKVLVVGYGVGYEIFYLSSLNLDVTGVDISSEAKKLVLKCLTNLNLNAKLQTADILTISDSKSDNYYDFVVDRFVFQNLPPKLRKKYSRKIASILKPRGNLLLKCLNSEKFTIKEGPPYTISKQMLLSSFTENFKFDFINKTTKSGTITNNKENKVYFFCKLKRI